MRELDVNFKANHIFSRYFLSDASFFETKNLGIKL